MSSTAENKTRDSDDASASEERRIGTIASLFYIIVILLVGIPIWYKTTTPSRHSLPDISSLLVHFQMVTSQIPISIVSLSDVDRDPLRGLLTSNWPHKPSADGSVSYEYAWKVRGCLKAEKTIFDQYKSLADVDAALGQLDGHQLKGKIFIYLLPKRFSLNPKDAVAFGSYRSAYVFVDEQSEAMDENALSELILETVDTMLEGRAAEKSQLMQLTDHASVNTYNTLIQSEIDVLINIIMEDVADSQAFQETKLGEIDDIAKRAFVRDSGVLELIDVKITSQMVYYPFTADLITSNLVKPPAGSSQKARFFNTSNVPQVLNAIESRVVEHDNKQSYQLTLYIPSTKSDSPLLFYDEATGKSSNSLITPYRGGILVWNDQHDFNVAFKTFMRSLICLPPVQMRQSLKKSIFFSKWELDSVIRKVAVLQLSKTLSSLESIEKLLDKVSNIVILQDISQRMHLAVQLSHQSIDNLGKGKLKEALSLSSKAYHASETAFFDPSLLALLYFPDDQKYAVYFPLFLPVSLPLMASMKHIGQSLLKK